MNHVLCFWDISKTLFHRKSALSRFCAQLFTRIPEAVKYRYHMPHASAQPSTVFRMPHHILLLTFYTLILLLLNFYLPSPVYGQSPVEFTAGWSDGINDYTTSIAWGDMDGDGDLDLAVGNYEQVNRVYRNRGDGVLQEIVGALDILAESTKSIAWGDVDSDGDLDLVVGNSGQVNRVYRNKGDGLFEEIKGALDFTLENTSSIAWGDVDGDGDLDLAVGNYGQINRIYRNNGNGSFEEIIGALGNLAEYTNSIAWGDVDGDGDLDLAVGNYGQINRIYRNNGNGNFEEIIGALGNLAEYTMSLVWGDIDSDDDLDLALGNRYLANRIYRNDGDGNFEEIVGALDNLAENTNSIAWGDVDGDGDIDLAVGNSGEVNRIYRNDGDGGFEEIIGALGTTVFEETNSIAWGDVDGDSDLDLAIGCAPFHTGGTNQIYKNMQTTTLNEITHALGTAVEFTTDVACGDVDNDGDLDIAITNIPVWNGVQYIGGVNQVYRNSGDGVFEEIIGALGNLAENTNSIAWGDVDGDNDLDLAVGNSGKVNRIYRNDRDGNFEEIVGALGSLAESTSSIAWGDVDGDSDLDIAIGNNTYPTQVNRIYRNDGDGNFEEIVGALGSLAESTSSIAWGDVDNDGDLDLAVGNSGQMNRVYRNKGEGMFEEIEGALGFATDNTQSIAWGDVDGDGDLDLAVGNWGQVNRVYRNKGDGEFEEIVSALGTFFEDTNSITWGDIDGDGDLDLAVGNGGYSGQVNRVYQNVGDGAFKEIAGALDNFAEGTGSIVWSDIDNDGDMDLVLGNSGPYDGPYEVNRIYRNTREGKRILPNNMCSLSISAPYISTADYYAVYNVLDSRFITITHTLYDPEGDPVGRIEAFYSPNGGGHWLPAVATTDTLTLHLSTSPWPTATITNTHVYTWDTFASGFFGQSDNVVLRMVAYPQPATAAVTGTYKYYNSTPGPFQRPYASATTFPFRVRGTQVRVFSETVASGNEAAGALVYRRNENTGSTLMSNSAGVPFHTDQHGYLQGRGQIGLGDQLLAMLPVSTVAEYAGALTFDGLNDYAIKNPFNNTPITETTVAFWISTTQATGAPFLYASPLTDATFLIANPGNLTLWRGNTFSITTPVTVTDGAWHHLAITWRSNDGQVKLYKDGIAAYTGTLATGTAISPGGRLVLGHDQDGDDFFRGSLDEVHFWNAVLTEDQILDEMYGILDIDDSTLVASWSFDDPANPGADTSGNDNALTLYGATWNGNDLGGYTVYHTNGIPTVTGADAFPVTQAGVQEIAVTAAHPLILFDLNVSLEWDAHNDPIYLQQLEADLKKASAYLYDFTDGQVALGEIIVYQNADAWGAAHIAVQATNRLRPFAHIGGLLTEIVTETVTVDGQEHTLTYGPGQIRMGATWNRYGDPAQSISVDWPLILAHELSHYLLYQYDVYIGLNEDDLLVPQDTCTGSAMGDVYAIDNTEFISDTLHWTTACSQTLAAKTLGRTEWDTLHTWYPWLISPTLSNDGPSQMPFEFTTVEIVAPTQAQETIEDPTFYLDYAGGVVSSSEARAFLLRDADNTAQPGPDDFDYIYDLGSPIGGQNRVVARGAQPGDRLCVFDNTRAQFGCEVIAAGDERLALKADAAWQPVIQLTPVNSTTFVIQITELASLTNTLSARIFPEFGTVFTPTTLAYTNGLYSATLTLPYPVMSGHVQVWVDEPASETSPRREAMVNFSIGGNPGTSRIGGIGTSRIGGIGTSRIGGIGTSRIGGIGTSRIGGIGSLQTGEAPLVSPDGQMILYLSDVITFAEGQFYTIQAMAGLPDPPAGRTLVGQGYNLVATGFLSDTSAFTGSVSIQYLGSDVLVAGVDENDLVIYFWDGTDWTALDTALNTTYNMASARSQGTGIYALMASVQTVLSGPGWNLIAYSVRGAQPITQALLSISGYYTTVYGYEADDPDYDPWKVYDVTVPEWVNDLTMLEFNHGYWINVSEAITLYLSSGTDAQLQSDIANLQSTIPLPPATFYGTISAAAAWTPETGMPVTARIDGTLCGQTSTREVDGHVMYAVNVFADDLQAGCGAPGKRVTFQVDGRTMAPTALWDDRQLWPVALRPGWQVYLPLVIKSWP